MGRVAAVLGGAEDVFELVDVVYELVSVSGADVQNARKQVRRIKAILKIEVPSCAAQR